MAPSLTSLTTPLGTPLCFAFVRVNSRRRSLPRPALQLRGRNKPGGPPPPHGLTGAATYGLPGLTVPNKLLVRLHTLILVRVAEISKIMSELGLPWIFETPALRDG